MAKSWGKLNLNGQGGNRCLCSVCGEVFSNVRNFDKHRDGRTKTGCLDPESVGLSLSEESGVWIIPQPFRENSQ